MNGNKDKGDADIRHDFPVAGLLMRTTHSIQREDLKVKMSILILLLNYFNGEKQSCAFWKMTHYIPETMYISILDITIKSTVMVILNNNEVKKSKYKTLCRNIQTHCRKRYFNKSAN
jgi:hypothetical protein